MSDDATIKHVCPRRFESIFGSVNIEDETPTDIWRLNPSEPPGIVGAGQRCCSYCGSMHPDDLFAAIERGDELGPTDKNYKLYVGKSPGHKFYFLHLSQSQQLQFVDLANSRKLNIGYPGHFYVMPFFMSRRK